VYWYHYYVRNTEYPLIMCETQNFNKMKIGNNPNVPQNYYKAMRYPEWREAIDKELTKFEKNLCFEIVPYNKQHLVPMMWTFVIKSDGTKKARLVGRGDLMLPYVDFDPYAVYCGNVTASSIKICITIAAKYKLFMKGGDLEGAYLVTRANPNYPVYIKTPQGYSVPKGMCIQAVGNLYGFPPAGQNFSIEFDKCVAECGYVNTPWDLKLFYKWKNNKPILLMVHSDDFRWFGDKDDLSEWQLLVTTFEKHKYKVSDATEKEFVGIRITRDEHYNYFLDQTRMIDDIMNEAHMKNEKDEKLPYPNPTMGPALSKLDNATDENAEDCRKFPYRRVIGQLMYGMVHTLVTIMYPLNVLSRYGNNPGPRHIQFAKHLLRYVRTIKMDRLRFNTHDGPTDIKTMTGELQLYFQCDADLAGNLDNKHSQTSYLGYLGGSLICWCSTDQGSISTSTAESEVKAVNHTLKCEVIANRGILTTMGWKQDPTVIQEDNKACIDASVVQHMTKRMRHLALTENFLKEKFAESGIKEQ
jgi:Reverse transcriptase (RNA-dependent DNA polymerase)